MEKLKNVSRETIGSYETLTVCERRMLEFIIEFKRVNQYSPSQREICKGLYCSQTYVKEYLDKLKEKGYITFHVKQSRTIVVNRF